MTRMIPYAAILAFTLGLYLPTASAGSVQGTVVLMKDDKPAEDHSGAVVYLEGMKEGSAANNPLFIKKITQTNLAFVPNFGVALKGSSVAFPNQDKVFHNVFSLSSGNRFDLPLYKAGGSESTVLKRSGVVDIYCNIHPQMSAKVLVLEHGYFAITDKDGKFTIKNVPAGNYPLMVWQRSGNIHETEVAVSATGVSNVRLEIKEGGKASTKHTRKDGTPYGRYK